MLTVYSSNGCASCTQAKELLKKCGVEFEEKNTSEDFEAFDFVVNNNHRTFPQIYKGNTLFVQGGYKGLYQMYLDGNL